MPDTQEKPGAEAYAVVALLIVVGWLVIGGALSIAWNSLPSVPDLSWTQGVAAGVVIFILASIWSLGQRTP